MIEPSKPAMGHLHTAVESWFVRARSSHRFLQRLLLVFFTFVVIGLLNIGRLSYQTGRFGPISQVGDGPARTEPDQVKLQAESMTKAGNSTLGFHSIKFINMRKRYDRTDAAVLQAYLSGIDLDEYPAVEKDMISDVGMPPTHRPAVLQTAEHGCWRAHANIWSDMLKHKLPPVLIFESDAAWDIDIRNVMSNLNRHFVEFLRETNSKPIPSPRWAAPKPSPSSPPGKTENSTSSPQAPIDYNPDDPWLSEHWDVLSLGHCFEYSGHDEHRTSLIYPDPLVPPGKDYYGYRLGSERVIRKSGGITCTTSYAVSQTGAAKLLLRSAVDLDNPVDLLIRRMTMSGDLVAYSVMPTVIAQWEYADDIGMGQRGAQSDIRGHAHPIDKDADMPGWAWVKDNRAVWKAKNHPDVAFQNMGLSVAWEKILGRSRLEDSQYRDEDGN